MSKGDESDFKIEARDTHKENPFIRGIKIKDGTRLTKVGNVTNLKVVDTITNKESSDARIVYASETLTDKTEFIKIYKKVLPIFLLLTKGTLKVLIYILDNKLEYNRDTINLSPEEIKNVLEIKKSSAYSEIIKELIANEILARTEYPFMYYMFYRGERRFLLFNKT